ncbi:hypothetical protein L6452_19308 [Arctium lappa]|uniref:Uncharacterized protein n=1 Tax=Arctium lappa TaxID=4217 RepID=A0ACB9B8R4_ARCLA|nr:hypothetical protein L6452_19308 [Arctium lappa]
MEICEVLTVKDVYSEVCSLKKEELKKTQESKESLTKATTKNSSDIQLLIKASANHVSNEDFGKLTEVVQSNTEALRCLAEIVNCWVI